MFTFFDYIHSVLLCPGMCVLSFVTGLPAFPVIILYCCNILFVSGIESPSHLCNISQWLVQTSKLAYAAFIVPIVMLSSGLKCFLLCSVYGTPVVLLLSWNNSVILFTSFPVDVKVTQLVFRLNL
jgi:hypothetical protein